MTAFAVDTNVVIYALDPQAGPKCGRARALLTAPSLDLRMPLQVLGEAFVVLTRKQARSARMAREALASLLTLFPTIALTSTALSTAMRLHERHAIPFWDAQLVATAAEHGCTALFTEDLQDGRHFGKRDVANPLRIVDPFVEANAPTLAALGVTLEGAG